MCNITVDTQKLISKINEIIHYVKPFLPLANCHMVSYITGNHFESLVPEEFKDEVKCMNSSDVYSLFTNCVLGENVEVNKAPNFVQYLLKCKSMYLQYNSNNNINFESLEKIFASKGYGALKSIQLKQFMSSKKSHEVELMCSVINVIATKNKSSHIVDIGGGKGYLSSMLALEHKCKVLSIDSSEINNFGAVKRKNRLEKVWNGVRKKITDDSLAIESSDSDRPALGTVKQVTNFVTDDTQLLEIMKEHYPGDIYSGLMLVGLHTCGNLAPSSMKLFVKNLELSKCLLNVGCCYHLIDEEFEAEEFWPEADLGITSYGFPISRHLRETKLVLGRNARMLAAQSIDRITNKEELNSEALFYRALLEAFLQEKMGCSDLPRLRVGRLANKSSTFADYVNKSLKKLEINNLQINEIELEDYYEKHKEERRLLQTFFLVRLALAPLIEAIILLDRLLYLHENGINDAMIVQLFDPVVSPRCFAIIAFNNQ